MPTIRQGIAHPCGVEVYGSALLRAEPDSATVRLGVSRIADKAAQSLAQTRSAVLAVRAALTAAGIGPEHIEVSRVTVKDEFSYGSPRKFLGYRSNVTFRIRIGDVDRVEPLVIAAVEAGANHVDAVTYETSRLAELRADARRTAVVNAKRKAELYAEAAGVRVGPVVHIQDVEPPADEERMRGSHVDWTGGPAGVDAGDALGSGSLDITAAVALVCTLLPSP